MTMENEPKDESNLVDVLAKIRKEKVESVRSM